MEDKFFLNIFSSAQTDLVEIVEYWKNELQTSSKPFLDDYENALHKIVDFPFAHHQPNDEYLRQKGYRIIPVRNYYIFYIVQNSEIQIHRILYNKMDFSKLF